MTTTNIWSSYDQQYNTQELINQIAEAASNSAYNQPPVGKYEVKITDLELTTSKSNKPMVKVVFEIVAGDKKGQKIYMNQLVTQGFQIHKNNTFLKNLGVDADIIFVDFGQYARLMEAVNNLIKTNRLEYLLDFSQNQKGYNEFNILEIYKS